MYSNKLLLQVVLATALLTITFTVMPAVAQPNQTNGTFALGFQNTTDLKTIRCAVDADGNVIIDDDGSKRCF